jgi:hypothetical protein
MMICKICKKEIGVDEGHYSQNPFNCEDGPICVNCMEEFKKRYEEEVAKKKINKNR